MPANPHELSDISQLPSSGETASVDPESASALDEALKAITEGDDGSDEGTGAGETATTPPAATDKKADPAPTSSTPPAKKDDNAAPGVPDPAKKFVDDPPTPAAGKKADETPAAAAVPPTVIKDELDSVTLPPYTKPKTGEAFAEVKKLAREKIAAIEKERNDLKAKTEELEKKASAGLPKEVEQELAELRAFRGRIDVQADPEFAKFDKQVNDNVDSIYTKLKGAGFTEEVLAKIKAEGGPGNIDWEALAEKIPASLKRFIDSKLVENETITDKKTRAIKQAQDNAEEYLKSKATEETTRTKARIEEANKHLQGFLPKVPWLSEQKVKDGATAEEKADAERHNKLVAEVTEGIKTIVEDETPAMRAIMAVNYAQHLKLKSDHAVLKSRSEAEIKELKAKLTEANDLLERVKKNSTNRLRNTPASSDRSEDGKPNATDKINDDPGSALDAIAKEVLAK